MNIDDMIKLKNAGFTIEEISQLMNNSSPQEMKVENKIEKVLDNSLDEIEVNKIEESGTEEVKPELNAFNQMLETFKDSMNEQMEAFKKSIQLSNMNKDIGTTDSGVTAEDVVANILNPYRNK